MGNLRPLCALYFKNTIRSAPKAHESPLNEEHANSYMNEDNYDQDNKEEHAKNCMNQDNIAQGMNHDNLNDNTNEEIELPPFSGRKFKNQRNDCYINAALSAK